MRTALRSLLALALLSTTAHAASSGPHASIYGGAFDALSSDSSALLGGEYRFKDQFNGLRPVLGAFVTSESAAYAYGGAYWDLPLGTAPFVITPGFVAGGYHSGADKDMGSGLQLRSSIEVAYELENGHRLGVAFSHMSNANIGDDNPGAETLQAVYSYPLW